MAVATDPVIITRDQLDRLIAALRAEGRQVIGPVMGDGAVVLAEIHSTAEMPQGWGDEQEGGHYRLRPLDEPRLFGHGLTPQGWKRWLHPPMQRILRAERVGGSFRFLPEEAPAPAYAFIGVRACELSAMQVQGGVFDQNGLRDEAWHRRREGAFVVAVGCAQAAATCFCVDMNTGPTPRQSQGADIVLQEVEPGRRFLARADSPAGEAMLAALEGVPADATDFEAAARDEAQATHQQRHMDPDVRGLFARNRDSQQWQQVAERCLACGNCTSVCPTCFCTTTEDVTDLSGHEAERWKRWDSCFTMDFSYIHGGSVRSEGASRYRQWISHKLSDWYEQFGRSGCVGCGRCITWCPVGIDITAEVDLLRRSEQDSDPWNSRVASES